MTDTQDRLRGLNPAQRDAVEHVTGPVLVIAGAGSGKTRVLTTRIAHLIDTHGVPPNRIFAVTFTNKAAGEMKERVAQLLSRDPGGLWIGTFHALSARLLRREADRLGFSRDFTIYDEDDRLGLIRRLMDEHNLPVKLFPPKLIQSLISSAKNRMIGPVELVASNPHDAAIRAAGQVYDAMQPALRAANAMDFDDLMLHPLELFRQHPDALARWQGRFDFLMVDEFQDTNRAQYQLVRYLGVSHRNVFVVGDEDQSIYGWRGADIRNLQEFRRDFASDAVIKLEENYRSTTPILDAANAVIARNVGRIGKTLRTVRPGGESILIVAAADERDEAEWIVRELERRHGTGAMYTECAVLYRTNAQSRALEESFRRGGVPYRIVGAISFYERREVKDLLAYLRLIANPADDAALLRAIGVPRRGIGDSSLALLTEAARAWKIPLLAAAGRAETLPDLRPNLKSAFRSFFELIEALRARSAAAPPVAVIEDVIRSIEYEALLAAEGIEGIERWENVRELVAAAAEWSDVMEDGEPGASPLQQFLAEAALLSAVDTSTGPPQGVTLMTLHTAKGLEWPIVVISGMEEGLFPSGRALEQPEGLEEERRLCYVGITRAKDALLLTWARSRRRGGELRPAMASRFLRELPSELVEERRTTSTWGGISAGGGWGGVSSGGWAGGRGGASRGRGVGETRQSYATTDTTEADAFVEDQDAPRYVKGERVKHSRFGSGAILGLNGAGKNLKVSVAFDDPEVGTKELLVAFAGLERDWEGA